MAQATNDIRPSVPHKGDSDTTSGLPPMPPTPYIHQRIVRWGDCDPAGIVYTPRFLDFLVEAVEDWFRVALNTNWLKSKITRGIGSPVVSASLDFISMIKVGDELECVVEIAEVKRASTVFMVKGRTPEGRSVFNGRLVNIALNHETNRAMALPPDYRSRMEAYMNACKLKADSGE